MSSNLRIQLGQEPVSWVHGRSILQRKCACGQHTISGGACHGCSMKKSSLQRATLNPDLETQNHDGVPPIVHEVLRSSGQPLDSATRAFFEPRFGHDFSRVRVHADARASESARAVNALAYTVGRDVVFGAGQYQSSSSAGRKLLGHELTHVVQQGGGKTVSRSTNVPAKRQEQTEATFVGVRPSALTSMQPPGGIATLSMGHPQDAAEVEADRVGDVVGAGRLALNVSAFQHKLNRQDKTPPPAPPRKPLDQCRKDNPFAQICADDERKERDEAVRMFLINEGHAHDDIGDMKWKKMKSRERGEIRDCDMGPGDSWHCSATVTDKGVKKNLIVSIFACLCCDKDDGTVSSNWNGPHWSGRHPLDEKVEPGKPGK